MAFIGAIVNAAKGFVAKANNKMIISNLEKELQKDLFEGLSEEEKISAEIKLKEAELELAIIRNKSRHSKSEIEKEIIDLMEVKLKKKMEELKKKEATQLDIAKTMIAIQKTSNEMKDHIEKMDKKFSDKIDLFLLDSANTIEKLQDTINAEFKSINKVIKNHNHNIDMLKKQSDSLSLDIKSESKRIDEMKTISNVLKESISRNTNEIYINKKFMDKFKKICIISYIFLVVSVGTSIWYFAIR